jgi:YggT family protein
LNIAGNLIFAIANVTDWVLSFFIWVIIIRALVSWVNADPHNPIVQFLIRVSEPILQPIRGLMGRSMMTTGIDLSPMVAILAIYFLRLFLVPSLIQLARQVGA